MTSKCKNTIKDHMLTMPGNDRTRQHAMAWREPRKGSESFIKGMIEAYAGLADASETNGILLGEDGYFGEHATAMIEAMRASLNIDMGRLDCGTLDSLICALAKTSGVEIDE
jgi:hypothetical protein